MQQLILGAIRADCRLRWPGRGWVLSTTEVAKEILTQEVGSAPLIPVDEQQANWTQLGGKGRLISPPFSGSDISKFVWLTILVRARSSSLTTKDTDYKAWWEKVWWGRVCIGKGDGVRFLDSKPEINFNFVDVSCVEGYSLLLGKIPEENITSFDR